MSKIKISAVERAWRLYDFLISSTSDEIWDKQVKKLWKTAKLNNKIIYCSRNADISLAAVGLLYGYLPGIDRCRVAEKTKQRLNCGVPIIKSLINLFDDLLLRHQMAGPPLKPEWEAEDYPDFDWGRWEKGLK
jgi:hypothetical protein